MKRILSIIISICMIMSALNIPAYAESTGVSTTTITPQMTYVDYDNADTAFGYIAGGDTAVSGYNKISDNTISMGNTGWGVNKITYLKVDASAVTDAAITGAVLTMDVSGSTDSKRTCGYGALWIPYTDWDNTLTYNSAVSNNMLSGTSVGDEVWTSTKSASVFETKTIDITDALKNDEDRIVTIAIYETAAAGGYIKSPSVEIKHTNAEGHTVTYIVGNAETSEIVYDGLCVSNIPKADIPW